MTNQPICPICGDFLTQRGYTYECDACDSQFAYHELMYLYDTEEEDL